MPRNGSGQYDLIYNWDDDKINGIKVLASRMQAQDLDIGTALTGSLASDGQKALSGNLDFNTNKAIDLGDGTDAGDAINVSQGQLGELQYYGISTTTPAGTDGEDYDISPSPTIVSYPPYSRFSFTCNFTCLDGPTLRFGVLATKTLVKSDGAAGYTTLVAGDMAVDSEYVASYNEDNSTTQIIIENPEIPIFNISGLTKSTNTDYGVSCLPSQITVENGADVDHDMDISSGNIQLSNNLGQVVCTAETKELDSTWVAASTDPGQPTGGLADSLTIAANTTYYKFALADISNGFVGYGFDTSLTAANLLADTNVIAAGGIRYSKIISSLLTDGASNIIPANYYFSKNGAFTSIFKGTPFEDFDGSSNTTPTNRLLTLPTGRIITAHISVQCAAASGSSTYLYSPNSDDPVNISVTYNVSISSIGNESTRAVLDIETDTSANIRTKSSGAHNIAIYTIGYTDNNL